MFKKILGGLTIVGAIGGAAIYYDVTQKQIYTCQPFSEAVKQYFTISAYKALGAQYQVMVTCTVMYTVKCS
jgi:hypothetical protein